MPERLDSAFSSSLEAVGAGRHAGKLEETSLPGDVAYAVMRLIRMFPRCGRELSLRPAGGSSAKPPKTAAISLQ